MIATPRFSATTPPLKLSRGNCADQTYVDFVDCVEGDSSNDLWEEFILSFGDDEKEDEDKPLSLAEKLRKKLSNMVKIRKGLTVDSGAADHVMPVGWLIMFVVLKSIGAIRGVHYVAADGTRIANVGQQLIRFMTIDGTWTEIMFQLAAIHKP